MFSLNIEGFVCPVSFFYTVLTRGEVCLSVNSKQDAIWFHLFKDWQHVENLDIVCFDVCPPLLHSGEDLSGQNWPVFDCSMSSKEAMIE